MKGMTVMFNESIFINCFSNSILQQAYLRLFARDIPNCALQIQPEIDAASQQ